MNTVLVRSIGSGLFVDWLGIECFVKLTLHATACGAGE